MFGLVGGWTRGHNRTVGERWDDQESAARRINRISEVLGPDVVGSALKRIVEDVLRTTDFHGVTVCEIEREKEAREAMDGSDANLDEENGGIRSTSFNDGILAGSHIGALG
jgi:hypothetical protein